MQCGRTSESGVLNETRVGGWNEMQCGRTSESGGLE